MRVNIISFNQLLYSGDFNSVVLPSVDGQISILPKHAPMISQLGSGKIKVRAKDGEKTIDIKSGVVEINFKEANILIDRA